MERPDDRRVRARLARPARDGPRDGDAGAPYLQAARQAAGFVRDRLWNPDTRRCCAAIATATPTIDGYAEDYACLIFGLLELFQADADPAWLEWAITLQRRQDELFWDEADGGWFSTTGRDASVLLRMKEDYDGAEPTASSGVGRSTCSCCRTWSTIPRGPSGSIARCACSARVSSRWAAPCR